ncbi:hypothetical protein C8Q73DRAFT_654818 [Cubamyces lactineus]|nr:hypothetical protein C8Q73DRAFT_654818 [Cubamyces lactineus]
MLNEVLYTSTLSFNLISISRIDDSGGSATFTGSKCVIKDAASQMIGRILKTRGLYLVVHEHNTATSVNTATNALEELTEEEAHHRFGHIAVCSICELISKGFITGIRLIKSDDQKPCKACIRAKLTRKPVLANHQG